MARPRGGRTPKVTVENSWLNKPLEDPRKILRHVAPEKADKRCREHRNSKFRPLRWSKSEQFQNHPILSFTVIPIDRGSSTHTRNEYQLIPFWASASLAQGVYPRVVMATLGHSQISFTLDTYSNVLSALGREAADRMRRCFQPRPSGEMAWAVKVALKKG